MIAAAEALHCPSCFGEGFDSLLPTDSREAGH